MDESSPPDLVEDFYAPLIRPLGNLVITFGQAEAALLALATELSGGDEAAGKKVVNSEKPRDKVDALLANSGLDPAALQDLSRTLDQYWPDQEARNRYIHAEWFVGIDLDSEPSGVITGTRGVPRKKGSDVVWDEPQPDAVWELARRFRDHRDALSHYADVLRGRRTSAAATQ